jgi:hypothetical protein
VNIAARVAEMMNKGDKRKNTGDSTLRHMTWRSIEVPKKNMLVDLTMGNVMAVRLQRAVRLSIFLKNESKGVVPGKHIRRATVNNYDGQGFEIMA